jgi:hypothetical protein
MLIINPLLNSKLFSYYIKVCLIIFNLIVYFQIVIILRIQLIVGDYLISVNWYKYTCIAHYTCLSHPGVKLHCNYIRTNQSSVLHNIIVFTIHYYHTASNFKRLSFFYEFHRSANGCNSINFIHFTNW